MDPNQLAELKPAVLSIVEELRTVYSAGKDFALEQAPLVAREMVYREIAKSTVWLSCGLFLLFICLFCWRKFIREADKEKAGGRPDEDFIKLMFTISAISGIFSIFFIVSNLLDLGSVIFAPRLFVLEQASKLIK